MNIYLVKRTDGPGWDEYHGFVCYAKSSREARNMHPNSIYRGKSNWDTMTWVTKKGVNTLEVTYLGKARVTAKPGAILTDFLSG